MRLIRIGENLLTARVLLKKYLQIPFFGGREEPMSTCMHLDQFITERK